MNIVPPDFTVSGEAAAGDGRAPFLRDPDGIEAKWDVLNQAGAVVRTLAGEEAESNLAEVRDFPAAIRDATPGRRALAEKGIEDLIALLEPGIGALLAVNARGIDAAHAAGALWREFADARAAVLALVPPSDA